MEASSSSESPSESESMGMRGGGVSSMSGGIMWMGRVLIPVLPNPFEDLVVVGKDCVGMRVGVMCGVKTSCAMQSPEVMENG